MMRAMLLEEVGRPLRVSGIPIPEVASGEVLVRVATCGVCRTDLHIADGDLSAPHLPLALGHEVVGTVAGVAPDVEHLALGDRIGVPWLGWTCGRCSYCLTGRENLCERARFTGYHRQGGYAEYVAADARYCFAIPRDFSDVHAAPLLCAGLIGYRSLRATGDAARLGLYGFGASAHIIAQVARFEGRRVFAFTRPGDVVAQELARTLGAEWAGDSTAPTPEPLDAAIIFAPVGTLVPAALKAVVKGGVVVCAGIHMSEIPAFPYELLWGERVLRSVANLTRRDGVEFMALAPRVPVRTQVVEYPLEEANSALNDLRGGIVKGAAVLRLNR